MIQLAKLEDVQSVFNLYRLCKTALEQEGIYQWTNSYPGISELEISISRGHVYNLIKGQHIVATVTIDDEGEEGYLDIDWVGRKALIIHRLAVHPRYQKQGSASLLMNFAESYAISEGYETIRLDCFSGNENALNFYIKRSYKQRGEILFPGRDLPFCCLEKILV